MLNSFYDTRLQGIMVPRIFNVPHLGLVLMNAITEISYRRVSHNVALAKKRKATEGDDQNQNLYREAVVQWCDYLQ